MLLDISSGSDLLLLICHSSGREPKATLLPPALAGFSWILTDPRSTAIAAAGAQREYVDLKSKASTLIYTQPLKRETKQEVKMHTGDLAMLARWDSV